MLGIVAVYLAGAMARLVLAQNFWRSSKWSVRMQHVFLARRMPIVRYGPAN